MKLPYKLVLITALVFSVFDGVASAATTETNLSINDEDTFAVTAGVTYRDLKVSHSVMLSGISWKLVSGADVVSLNPYGLVTGRSEGDAIIYAYENGRLYWKHYIRVND
ncbi:hypothetical protein [Paenibacillus apiarius]|uniref:hypothetical protein n=1 Tax=Paenibacillus apiarius TaxID=46240 RepID=UPI003B3BA56F